MNTLTEETLKAAFHAMAESMRANLRKGYTFTAEEEVEHLEALAAVIEDEWYMGRISSYKELVEEATEYRTSLGGI